MTRWEPTPNPPTASQVERPAISTLGSRSRRGVTVFEILAVVAFVALVGGALAWVFGARDASAADGAARDDAKGIASAVVAWQADHGEGCPSVTQLMQEGYLAHDAARADVWGQRFRLTCRDAAPVVYSAGPDGRAGTQDDVRVLVR